MPDDPGIREIEDGIYGLDRWVFRWRKASDTPGRSMVMLHGWTGNEDSMWVFTHRIPKQYDILLPRAPFPFTGGGYSWHETYPGGYSLPSYADLLHTANRLSDLWTQWSAFSVTRQKAYDVLGFSQGGAMALSLAMSNPSLIERIIVLSGFLPKGIEDQLKNLQGKKIFITHGRKDNQIPVEHVRGAVTLLIKAGAEVQYCETESGHKVGKECLKNMETFLTIG